jgi:hypothetical protein
LRVAFILKGYPRLSETFIAQEIAALERRGLDILIVSVDGAVPGATNRARIVTDRRTGNTAFDFISASLGNGLGNFLHCPGENCHMIPESALARQPGFSRRGNDVSQPEMTKYEESD